MLFLQAKILYDSANHDWLIFLTVLFFLIALKSFFLSLGITALILRCAPYWGLVQSATHRSNHRRPIPTAGGLGFITAFSLISLGTSFQEFVVLSWILAFVGFWDDRGRASVGMRLVTQIFVVVGAVYCLWPLPEWVVVWPLPIELQVLGLCLFGVWWINVLNFFDGTDGLSSSQSLLILISAFVLACLSWKSLPISWGVFMTSLVGGLGGFLCLNWPPARIFMGNTSSMWLGFTIFCLALWSVKVRVLDYGSWLILMSVPLVDATWTLITRILNGSSWIQPHTTHVYQQWEKRWPRRLGHRRILLGIGLIHSLWVLPLATLSVVDSEKMVLWALLTYGPLCVWAWYQRAGYSS